MGMRQIKRPWGAGQEVSIVQSKANMVETILQHIHSLNTIDVYFPINK